MTRDEHGQAAERWAAEAEMARLQFHSHAKQQQRHFYAGDSVAMGMHSRLEDDYRELFKLARKLAFQHQRKAGLSAGRVA